jgi:outer membrane protein, heavy metal efflux system
MNIPRSLSCLILSFICIMSDVASTAPLLEAPLDLSEIIHEGLAQNPEIQAARSQWEATREQVPQATALPDPRFGVQLWNIPQNGNLSTSVTRTQNTIYTLSQTFPFPGKLPLRGEIANRTASISEQALRGKERDLVGRLKHTYFELFFAHRTCRSIMTMWTSSSSYLRPRRQGFGPEKARKLMC